VVTVGANFALIPISEHDALKNRGEWGHPDPGGYQDCMLGPEDVAGWGSVWAINENL
jgi:hypothetical protein